MSCDYFPNSRDYILSIFVCHPRVKRKGKQTWIEFLTNRELLRVITVAFAVERVPVQRDEMNASADIADTQLIDEF